jgi:hypothetical protein
LILGNREGLAWVLENERMAFSEANASRAQRLEPGDRLFLYTTRTAFGDFHGDRSRIIGEAEVTSPVVRRSREVKIGGRAFTRDCKLEFLSLAPFREGLEFAPLVAELEAFPNPSGYSAQLRRPLVPLSDADARLIRSRLRRYVGRPEDAKGSYSTGALRPTTRTSA